MTFWRFAEIRALRLYPLYILGCMITLVYAAIWAVADGELWRARDHVKALPFALALLPNLMVEDRHHWFDLNPPAWSLFYEWAFNLAYAALLPFLSTRVLVAVASVSFVVVSVVCFRVGGIDHPGITDGFLALQISRPLFGLSSGVVLYRLWRAGALPAVRFPVLATPAIFLLITLIPRQGFWAGALIPLALAIAVPAAIVTAINNEPRGRVGETMEWLGALSYPVYALHWPILIIMWWPLLAAGAEPVFCGVIVFSTTVLASWAALRFFDEPVRKLIGDRLRLWRSEIVAARPL